MGSLCAALAAVPEAIGTLEQTHPLPGGYICTAHRVVFSSGRSYVIKGYEDPPAEMFPHEARGLDALRREGCPKVPTVVAVSSDYLVLEDLGSHDCADASRWEEFGRRVAALHSIHSERYGLDFDNYIGTARLVNKWNDSGYDFFREHRIFGFLNAGMCDKVLTTDDRRNTERFAGRLEELVPPQAPSLCHGDLWQGNVLLTEQGLAYFDPAPYYGWAEADLAVTNFPEPFYGAYVEASGVEGGLRERSEVYLVREYLIMTALFGDQYGTVEKLRELLGKYV